MAGVEKIANRISVLYKKATEVRVKKKHSWGPADLMGNKQEVAGHLSFSYSSPLFLQPPLEKPHGKPLAMGNWGVQGPIASITKLNVEGWAWS